MFSPNTSLPRTPSWIPRGATRPPLPGHRRGSGLAMAMRARAHRGVPQATPDVDAALLAVHSTIRPVAYAYRRAGRPARGDQPAWIVDVGREEYVERCTFWIWRRSCPRSRTRPSRSRGVRTEAREESGRITAGPGQRHRNLPGSRLAWSAAADRIGRPRAPTAATPAIRAATMIRLDAASLPP